MDNRINEAFESLKMSEECASRISSSFEYPATRRTRISPVVIAAVACLSLVIFVSTSSTAISAVETIGENIIEAVTSLFYPNAKVEEQYTFENGYVIFEKGTTPDGNNYTTGEYNTMSIPTWLEVTTDGLYFIGNGERIEIGELISEEDPFTYVMTDADGIRHYIVVGGVYEVGMDPLKNVGWAHWMQKAPYDDMMRNWIGGYSKGDGPWYNKGREILGIIPWGRSE